MLFLVSKVLHSQSYMLKYLQDDKYKEFRAKYSNDSIAIDILYKFKLFKPGTREIIWYKLYDIGNCFLSTDPSSIQELQSSASYEIKAIYWLNCIYLKQPPIPDSSKNINYLDGKNNYSVYDYDIKNYYELKRYYKIPQSPNLSKNPPEIKYKKKVTEEYKNLRGKLTKWYLKFKVLGLEALRNSNEQPMENYTLKVKEYSFYNFFNKMSKPVK